MTAYATVDDVTARWPTTLPALTPAQLTLAGVLLDDASALVRARVPLLDERLADGSLDAALVTRVVVDMVKGALIAESTNPTGATRVDESVDDARFSYQYATANAALVASIPDLSDLMPPGSNSGAFTITPAGSGPRWVAPARFPYC